MKESLIFEDLEKIAVKHDIRITTANLKKYAYYMKSGLCRVRGEYRLIIDKHLHLSEKIDVMIDALQHFDVESSSLDPVVRRLLEKKTKDARQGLFHPETAVSGESMVNQAGSLQ
jgi:hypothetical protein